MTKTEFELLLDRVALLEDQVALLMNVLANRTKQVPELATMVATPPPDHQILGFTAKQHATLQLLALGQTNQDIADVLEVSESTAKVHVRAIMRKLNVKTRTDIAQLFREMVSRWPADEYQRVAGIEKDWAINPDAYPITTARLREQK